MRKILSIIVVSLLLNGNAYSNDIYSQENRKKSEIKINCKINWIMKFANQDGLHASKYDTSDLPKMINDPKLPGFIVETNLNSRPVWINRVAVKADENWREELSIIRFEQANEKDFVVVRKYNIDYTTKSTKGEDYSFSIATSFHLPKSDFKGKNIPFNILEADIEDTDLNLKRIKENFNSTSKSYGGCNKIDPKNFEFEETVVQNEIRIAEYEAKKEKELLNKKKEELNKANITEGKFELNCKDGVLYKAGRNPEPFDDTLNRLVDINNQSYKGLNIKSEDIHYLISTELDNFGNVFLEYRFDEISAQIIVYSRDVGELSVATAQSFSKFLYQDTKKKLDDVNKRIDNYKLQKDSLGNYDYKVSNLGTKIQEFEKFEIVRSLINTIRNVNVTKVTSAIYKCNKI